METTPKIDLNSGQKYDFQICALFSGMLFRSPLYLQYFISEMTLFDGCKARLKIDKLALRWVRVPNLECQTVKKTLQQNITTKYYPCLMPHDIVEPPDLMSAIFINLGL